MENRKPTFKEGLSIIDAINSRIVGLSATAARVLNETNGECALSDDDRRYIELIMGDNTPTCIA